MIAAVCAELAHNASFCLDRLQMVADALILSLDFGTQSVRAMLFDAHGAVHGKAQLALNDYQAPQPGWMEHDADGFWQVLGAVCQQLWSSAAADARHRLIGISLTTQRATMVALDAEGQALRPAIVWPDQRRANTLPRLRWHWRSAFRLLGLQHTVQYFHREADCNWLAEQQPELWSRTAHYLLLSGFLTWKLTGHFRDSTGCQVGYVPYDFKHHRWAAAWDWKWQALPALRREQLPELLPPGSVLGHITDTASSHTGIPAGLPLIAAAADKACEVLGSGALQPHIACLSFGTTATINTTQTRYIEPLRFIPPYPAAIPDAWNTEIQISRGYWMVSWFKEEFGHPEQALAEELGVTPEQLFEHLADTAEPGAMGLMLQPYWSPGVKQPGPEARGAIIGFTDSHNRAHLYRAILEGLSYALREAKERIEQRSGTRITELRIAGGGSQSDAAMQLTADIFGLPATRPRLYEASALGAAMVAAVSLGLHADHAAAVKAMCQPGQTFLPDPARQHRYQQLYQRVYRQLYKRLQPLYRALYDINHSQ